MRVLRIASAHWMPEGSTITVEVGGYNHEEFAAFASRLDIEFLATERVNSSTSDDAVGEAIDMAVDEKQLSPEDMVAAMYEFLESRGDHVKFAEFLQQYEKQQEGDPT